jgi:hypothetical protein
VGLEYCAVATREQAIVASKNANDSTALSRIILLPALWYCDPQDVENETLPIFSSCDDSGT